MPARCANEMAVFQNGFGLAEEVECIHERRLLCLLMAVTRSWAADLGLSAKMTAREALMMRPRPRGLRPAWREAARSPPWAPVPGTRMGISGPTMSRIS